MLEEEGDSCIEALIAYVANPLIFHWPCARPAFAADDDPMDTVEIEVANRADERFEGEKSNRCVGLSKMTDTR